MGILDMVEQAAGGMGGGDKSQVAGGLMQEVESRPGGVGGIFSAFQNNGMGGLVQQWAGGQTTPASPDQVEQGLGGTGLIESISNRIGMSPTMVNFGLRSARLKTAQNESRNVTLRDRRSSCFRNGSPSQEGLFCCPQVTHEAFKRPSSGVRFVPHVAPPAQARNFLPDARVSDCNPLACSARGKRWRTEFP